MKFIRFFLLLSFLSGSSTFVHEGGHYLAAKSVGIKVIEVAVGYSGPELAAFRIGETAVTFRLGSFLLDGGHTRFDERSMRNIHLLFLPYMMLSGSLLAALYLFGLYRLFRPHRTIEPLKASFLGPALWPFLSAFRGLVRDRAAIAELRRRLAMDVPPEGPVAPRRPNVIDRIRQFSSALGQLDPAAAFMWVLFLQGFNIVLFPMGGMDGGKTLVVMATLSVLFIGQTLTMILMIAPFVFAIHSGMTRRQLERELEAKLAALPDLREDP